MSPLAIGQMIVVTGQHDGVPTRHTRQGQLLVKDEEHDLAQVQLRYGRRAAGKFVVPLSCLRARKT